MRLPYEIVMGPLLTETSGLHTIVTKRFPTWSHTKRRVGGDWMGGGEFVGSALEKVSLFTYGLGRRIWVNVGANRVWDGFTGEMELDLGGTVLRRSLIDESFGNAVQAYFTRSMGENLLANGSAELGDTGWGFITGWHPNRSAICPDGLPADQTPWVAHGQKSFWMETKTDKAGGRKFTCGNLVAGSSYEVNCILKSYGWWRVELRRSDTNQSLGEAETDGSDAVHHISFSFYNGDFSGGVYLWIFGQEDCTCYVDGAGVYRKGYPSMTGWQTEADSISRFGRVEKILSLGALEDAAVLAHVQSVLPKMAWARPKPPDELFARSTGEQENKQIRLTVRAVGRVWTMAWLYMAISGTGTVSDRLTQLATGMPYFSVGHITTNATALKVYDQGIPARRWDAAEAAISMADSSGNFYRGGVNARYFTYDALSTIDCPLFDRGRLLERPARREAHALLAEPGWVEVFRSPIWGGGLSGKTELALISEVGFTAPDKLTLRREQLQ